MSVFLEYAACFSTVLLAILLSRGCVFGKAFEVYKSNSE
jgi:hypothetical protein